MNLITTPTQVGYTPAATSIVHSTTASLTSRSPVQPVCLVQYDQTMPVIAVALAANDQPYTVPSGAAVNVRMDKPDGTHVYDPALGLSSDGQTAYIGITAQMTAAAGNSNPIVEIVVNEGVAGTAAFRVIIDPNPVPESAYESTDEFLTLYEILQQAQAAAQIVEENQQNLQNVTDNLEAIQGAAANANAAAASAAAAQQAAQQALGFRTFFSAVSPDANGDLDPSRPMTTPSAQASWTVKSRGDRIQSVQVNGFTAQAGTGDPSPVNVRAISTAGLKLSKYTCTGQEAWAASALQSGNYRAFLPASALTIPAKAPASSSEQATIYSNLYKPATATQSYTGVESVSIPAGGGIYICDRDYTSSDPSPWKAHLQALYAAGTPLEFWYEPADESQATGLYLPKIAQGHEYRCEMMKLTARLCEGDYVQSRVPSGCDKTLTIDGSTVAVTASGSNYIVTAADAAAGGNVYAEGLPYLSLTAGQIVIPATSFPSSVTSAQTANTWMQSNPQKVWYQSTAYAEANDIPVQLETHQQTMLTLNGNSGWIWNINPSGSVYRGYINAPQLKNAGSILCSVAKKGDTSIQVNAIQVDGGNLLLSLEGYTSQNDFEAFKAYLTSNPVTVVAELSTTAIYAHDPANLVAVPYTEADATAAQQLASAPVTLPYIDSADVPMLLDSIDMPEPDVVMQSDGTLDAENTQKAADWVLGAAAKLMSDASSSSLPVAGTYVVSSQDGTTVLVNLKAMQDGGDAATVGGQIVQAGSIAIGQINASSENGFTVNLAVPMPGDYAVSFGMYQGGDYWPYLRIICTAKTSTSFNVVARNENSSGASGAFTLDWIAVGYKS